MKTNSRTPPAGAPLVSVGVASFNNSHYIVQLLESIRQQTYENLELLVVDDCSTDDSVATIKKWAAATAYPLQLHQMAHNQGLIMVVAELRRRAKGEYVIWLGSDDWLLPHLVAHGVAEFARRGPHCGVVYSDCRLVDSEGQDISPSFMQHFNARFGPAFPEGNIRVPLLSGFYVPTVTSLVRRAALDQIGPYDETLKSEDLDTWLRLSQQWSFAYLPELSAAYRVHSQSLSQNARPQLSETFFTIYRKTAFEPGPEREAARHMLAEHAEHYYASQGQAAASALWYAFGETKQPKLVVFWLMSCLGVKHDRLLALRRRQSPKKK